MDRLVVRLPIDNGNNQPVGTGTAFAHYPDSS